MTNRTVGSVFMTRLVSFRGVEGANKQGENSRGEVIAIGERHREGIAVGDTVICRVEERTASVRDENGDIVYNEDGSPKLSNDKFIRNEVIAFGTSTEMTQRFYADEILEAEAKDIIADTIAAAKVARKVPAKVVKAEGAVSTEPMGA